MRNVPTFVLCLMAMTVPLLTACGSGNDKTGAVRVLNVSTGYNSLDLYANDGSTSTDTLELQSVAYGTASSYANLKSGTYTVKFKVHSLSDTLETLSSAKFADETHTTYVAFGSSGNFSALTITEDQGTPDSGKSEVQVYNTAEAGALDIYLTDASASLTDASPTFSAVASGGSTSLATLDKGTYRLRVTGTGDKTDLRLDVASITLTDQKVGSLIITSTQGGVLVNALFLPQQGSVTEYLNTQSRVRAAIGMANGTAATVSVGGLSLLSNATVGVVSSGYGQVAAGTAAVNLVVDGSAVTVPDQTLVAGADYTLLVWSDADGTQTSLISDDNHAPTSASKVKLRLLNGMSGLGGPITLTANFSPVAEGIAVGQASTADQIDAGSDFELDVSNASTGATLLSKTSVSLQAGNVYTMFLSGGGSAAVVGTLHKDR